MQMLLAAMLIDALHAALENRIVAFYRVGGDSGRFDDGLAINARLVGDFVPIADVFLVAVFHGVMAGEVRADFGIDVGFVGHQPRFAGNVGADDRSDLRNRRAVNMETASRAAALDKGKYGVLAVGGVARALGLALKATDVGFINFDNAAVAAHRRQQAARSHGFPNAMGQEPSGLVGDAQGAVKLMGTNALLAGSHQEERLKPDVQLDMAAFHDALGRDAEVFPATLGATAVDTWLLGRE